MSEEKSPNLVKMATPLVVLLLLVAAFVAGSSWRNWQEGQTGSQLPEEGTSVVSPSPQLEPESEVESEQVLSADDLSLIEDSEIVKGNPGAPVTIVEFSEYQCPFCQRYVQEAYAQIWEEYGEQIRYIFRDYPLPFHQYAQLTAEAARCAGEQGQYWEYHDLLFARKDEWETAAEPKEVLQTFAQDLSLNTTQFGQCLDTNKYAEAVQADFQLGQQVGVSGTPSFFINGRMLVGAQPFANFQAIIDEELAQ